MQAHRTMSRFLGMSVVAVSLLGVVGPAMAKDPKPPKGGKSEAPVPTPSSDTTPAEPDPWAVNVPASEQEQARTLAAQASELFAKNDYARAADLYQEALKHWNNPRIHYNLTHCLVGLGRWLEASAAIRGALEYDGKALNDTQKQQLQTYKGVVEKSLATVKVTTSQDGVEVTLDGERLVAGVGTGEKTVTAGSHALVATKPGFETVTKALSLNGGAAYVEEITLKPQVVVKTYERRWKKAWMPWVIAGSGAGVALLGGAAMLIARADMDNYNSTIEKECSGNACSPDVLDGGDNEAPWVDAANARKDRAILENAIGIGLVAAGGAALVSGLVMVALNQPHEVEVKAPATTVGVVPTSGGFQVGLSHAF